MKNVVFCDIDGTIIDGSRDMKEISDKTKYAIRELCKNNYVFIASGRCKKLLDYHITNLNPSGYILCNGAYAEVDGKVIHSLFFEDEHIEKVKNVVRKYDGLYILEASEEVYVNSITNKAATDFFSGWGVIPDFFTVDENPVDRFQILMLSFADEEKYSLATSEIDNDVDVVRHNTTISCDVNIKGINKGTAVSKVIEYLNIPYENTYCFGDGINDLEMLQSVKHPIIMKNCAPSLRNYGFEETDDVLHDGFYNYLVINKLIKAL